MAKATPLKIAIVSSGKTIREVAGLIDRHETEVSRWANDVRPCPPAVQKALARVLGTTVPALWPEDEDVERVAA